MADTGAVPAIDLNADLGEHDVFTAGDLALLDLVTSASLACGFHAGNRAVMRRAAEECLARGVAIGAHVSYRDRSGFGRTPLDVTPEQLAVDVVEQWESLAAEVAAAGGTVSYVKPHGALYHRIASDPIVASAVMGALAPYCAVLVGPPGGPAVGSVRPGGLRFVAEGFCDRGYDANGLLVPRQDDGALIIDSSAVGERARSLAVDRGVVSRDGRWVSLEVETLCIHGDGPDADHHARTVRESLRLAGVSVRAFAAAPTKPTSSDEQVTR